MGRLLRHTLIAATSGRSCRGNFKLETKRLLLDCAQGWRLVPSGSHKSASVSALSHNQTEFIFVISCSANA